jgi:outer membrane receptor protein involved in Fe transport
VTDGSEITVDLALAKSIQRLAEVVTTGALVPTEVKALPSPVTVISRESIAQQRPRSLPELFRQAVPGAVSWDITTRPEETDFSVRGASTLNPGGSQMKVFVDGIEATAFGVTVVDPSSIDRVEVVRGPQAAAVYGSDAIGGVIQVFTKRGDPAISRPQLEAETAFGVVQTPYAGFGGVLRQTYAAAVRGGAPNVSYNFGAGYSRTADYLPYGEESSQSSPGVYGGVNYARGIVSVDVSGRYHVTNSPSVVNPELVQSGFVFYSKPLYQSTRWTNQTVGLRLGVAATPWWHHNLTLGIDEFSAQTLQSQPRLTTPDDTLFTLVNLASAKRSIGYSTSFQSDPGHQVSAVVTAGVDHWSLPLSVFATDAALKNSGPVQTPEGVPISASQFTTNNTGYYVQGQLGMSDALFLTAGLRGEENSNFGDSLGTPVSPRLGVSYARSVGAGTVKVRGSWGRAIRAPDPGAKLTTGPGRLPNPGLAPERQQGWDAGLDAVIGSRGSISVTYYHQMAENLIQFVRVQNDPEPLDQFQNVGEVKNTGIEIEGSLHLGRLELNANYAYTRARIKELGPNYSGDLRVGDQVRATPKHTAGAFLTLIPRHGTTLSSGIAYVGRYSQTDFVALFRCIGGTGPCTPDFIFVSEYPSFVKVNGTISQQLSPLVSGFLSIDNVGNSHAAESGNIFPVLGRITTAGVRVQW